MKVQKLFRLNNKGTWPKEISRANKYAITWRLQTAKKPETREKRMKSIIEMLSQGKKFH